MHTAAARRCSRQVTRARLLGRQTVSLALAALSVVYSAGTSIGAVPNSLSKATNEIVVTAVSGDAWLNQAPLTPGVTLYTGDHVRLSSNAATTIELFGGDVWAAAGSAFTIEPGGIRLERGRVRLQQKQFQPFRVQCDLFTVVLDRGNSAVRAEIGVTNAGGHVTPSVGVASVVLAGDTQTYQVRAGESALIGDEAAQSAQQLSGQHSFGKVSSFVPEAHLLRGGQQLNVYVQNAVYANDQVSTGRTGKLRIDAEDGSIISVGPESSVLLVSIDAAAKQTQLNLAFGRLHWRLPKSAVAGASYTVHAATAIAYSTDGDFYLYATPASTELIVFAGTVRLTNLTSGLAVETGSGTKVVIARSGEIDGPTKAMPEEMEAADMATAIPSGRQPVESGKTHSKLPIILIAAAAGAAAAGASFAVHSSHSAPVSPSVP